MNSNKILGLAIGCMFSLGSNLAFSLEGKIEQIYGYSYIDGLQLYWEPGYANGTSCPSPQVMTLRGGDVNGKTMVSMAYTAFAAGYVLVCEQKPGCNGVNGVAEINYCVVKK